MTHFIYVQVGDIVITLCCVKMWILSYLQSGQTALMNASSGGYVECATVLLDRGALADRSDEVSAMSGVCLT